MAQVEQTMEISDNASDTSEFQAPPPTESSFKLVNVLENLILIGMCSLDLWEGTINKLKCCDEVISDPEMFNLFMLIRDLYNTFSNKIYTKNDNCSQDKLIAINMREMSYEEIMDLLKPILKKVTYKNRSYSSKCVHSLMKLVRNIIHSETEDKNTNQKKRKSNDVETPGTSKKCRQVATDECSDDTDDEFGKIFSSTVDQNRSVMIKQVFHYQTGNERRRLTTPGETGDFLVKIEISDMKDLQKCKNEKSYWTKVMKKAYFVAGKNDVILNDVNQIVLRVGKQIAKTKDVETSVIEVDDRRFSFNK